MQVKQIRVADLVPYARNARTHSDAQIEQIAASIREFGWTNPMLVEGNGIIAGHGRLQAAVKLGMQTVPCIELTGLSEGQRRAYIIADNKLALNAGWDAEMLKLEIAEFSDLEFDDLNLIGFSDSELATLLPLGEGNTDADQIPPTPLEAVSKLGDLWICGTHRLLCGDSTKAEDVHRLMNGERAVLFATDPPYAVNYTGDNRPAPSKDWSAVYREASDEELGEPFYGAFIKAAVAHAITENAAWYCWHADRRLSMLERVWNSYGAFMHQQIIWVKSRTTMTYSIYRWGHEPCLFGWVKGNRPRIHPPFQEYPSTVWAVPNSEEHSTEHPTSKPARLFSIPIEMHTNVGELCYEPFCGSGTHIIAAEQTKRRCNAIEISPVFVDVAVKRWQNFTGLQAVREGDGVKFDDLHEEALA